MRIRPATVADCPRVSALLQHAVAYQQQLSPFFDLVPRIDWEHVAQMKLRNLYEQVLVAEQDAQLLGYIDVRAPVPTSHSALRTFLRRLLKRCLTPVIVQPRNVGWIEDCYVLPEVRRQGVGRALVHAGVMWLQAHAITRVELAVLAANRGGRRFWQQQGFAPLRLLLSRDIDDGRTPG